MRRARAPRCCCSIAAAPCARVCLPCPSNMIFVQAPCRTSVACHIRALCIACSSASRHASRPSHARHQRSGRLVLEASGVFALRAGLIGRVFDEHTDQWRGVQRLIERQSNDEHLVQRFGECVLYSSAVRQAVPLSLHYWTDLRPPQSIIAKVVLSDEEVGG